MDYAADYQVQTSAWGRFGVYAIATNNRTNSAQVITTVPAIEAVGGLALPKWKANATFQWEFGQWSAAWTTRFFNHYCLNVEPGDKCGNSSPHIIAQGSDHVPSQVYHDLFVRYRVPEGQRLGILDDADVKLGITNLFNKEPPLDLTPGFQGYSSLGDPRRGLYLLSLTTRF